MGRDGKFGSASLLGRKVAFRWETGRHLLLFSTEQLLLHTRCYPTHSNTLWNRSPILLIAEKSYQVSTLLPASKKDLRYQGFTTLDFAASELVLYFHPNQVIGLSERCGTGSSFQRSYRDLHLGKSIASYLVRAAHLQRMDGTRHTIPVSIRVGNSYVFLGAIYGAAHVLLTIQNSNRFKIGTDVEL